MCVIAIAVKHRIPLAILEKCEETNPHGGGVAWVADGTVHFKKNITAAQAHELVKDKPLPHVFHFRIASIGGVIPALCHPFAVRNKCNDELEGTTQAAFFHNGTVKDWKFFAKLAGVNYPEYASDSMVVARLVALRGKSILEDLPIGRFAILNADRSINLYGEFLDKDGCLYSNLFWTYEKRRAEFSHHRLQAGQDEDGECGSTSEIQKLRTEQAVAQRELELEQRQRAGNQSRSQYDCYTSRPAGIPGNSVKKPVAPYKRMVIGGQTYKHTGGVVTTPGDLE